MTDFSVTSCVSGCFFPPRCLRYPVTVRSCGDLRIAITSDSLLESNIHAAQKQIQSIRFREF
jgi:hypothetical protein